MRWPKHWSFSFSISPSNEHPGLTSFRMAWLDLLAVQGALKSFLQHHSSKALIFQPSAFFIVQLSHPYKTTGKTIALIDTPKLTIRHFIALQKEDIYLHTTEHRHKFPQLGNLDKPPVQTNPQRADSTIKRNQ